MQMEFNINPRRIGIVFGIIAMYLALQSIMAEYLVFEVIGGEMSNLQTDMLDLFSVNLEESIPTWFSTINLLVASGLLLIISLIKRQTKSTFALHWLGLSAVFFYLSLDEGAVIHEIFTDPMRQLFNAGGVLYFGWVIVAFPLVLAFGIIYLRFLFHLPHHTRNLFILSGVMYVGGAIFIEGVSASKYDLNNGASITYLAIATVEEFFEMLGVIVFIYALLSYIADSNTELQFTVRHNPERDFQWRRWAIPAGLIVVIANLAMILWVFTVDLTTEQPNWSASYFYASLVDEYGDEDVVITQITRIFAPDEAISRQIVNSLFEQYAHVLVIGLPTDQLSIIVAGNIIPFDRDDISELLRSNGVSEFIIFDTPLVRAIAGDT